MRRSGTLKVTALLLLLASCLAGKAAAASDLTFEQRVEAQAAIERVYFNYQQQGTTGAFEDAVPHALLERKVRTYLEQNAALVSVWQMPVTPVMLQRELQRIARASRMPRRLEELFAALDNDPFLIQECLVRPLLVNRLARKLFESDFRIHAGAVDQAEAVRTQLADGTLDPWEEHASRRVMTVERLEKAERLDRPAPSSPRQKTDDEAWLHELSPVQFDRWRQGLPQETGIPDSISGEPEAFVVSVVLDELPGLATVASYTFPRQTWDAWWAETRTAFEVSSVVAVADEGVMLPLIGGTTGIDCDGDSWAGGMLKGMPDRRQGHTAVWTGSEMIVWGGNGLIGPRNTGLRYDPATDAWTPTSNAGAPAGRSSHTAVWTGSEMIVWGGQAAETGGRYDPFTDSWSATSTDGAGPARQSHMAVWTGGEMIIWGGTTVAPYGGGDLLDTGRRYDPDSDSWSAVSNAGAPTARWAPSVVWTGTHMIIWGGYVPGEYLNDGRRYDPATNSWTATSPIGAPSARMNHSAVWTGTHMIVFGGNAGGIVQNTGGGYDPAANTWTMTSSTGASERSEHIAVWTGGRMIVWGGQSGVTQDTGEVFDPSSNSWASISTEGFPGRRRLSSAVWTGDEMIVWGGNTNWSDGYYEVLDTGGRYDLASDSWSPTYSTSTPQGRLQHTAVWSGTRMVVWGGGVTNSKTLQLSPTGGRYDPTTDSWEPTATSGAPQSRYGHTAVWTGSRMIVWGGGGEEFGPLVNGGRYDPVADQWASISTAGAPSARELHTAVWTGSRMIVWGGAYDQALNTGAIYDPASDSWTPTSTEGTPPVGYYHSAVWSGDRMIVWGGVGEAAREGGLYDSASDSWTRTSTEGAPAGRHQHVAVWTGSRMIVWGGVGPEDGDPGGIYDPVGDSWSFPSTVDQPSPRYSGHTAIWTGNTMVIWGGGTWSYNWSATGGVYDPVADVWADVKKDGAPSERANHTAVWTGDEMIVWGGSSSFATLHDGGLYDPDGTDFDGDGSGCVIDCDDEDPSVFASPGPIGGLVFTENRNVMRWEPAEPTSGPGTTYDVLRGIGSELPVGAGASEICLATGYPLPPGTITAGIEFEDTEEPSPGVGFWYLVRGDNSCGTGSYGFTSTGDERVSVTCP